MERNYKNAIRLARALEKKYTDEFWNCNNDYMKETILGRLEGVREVLLILDDEQEFRNYELTLKDFLNGKEPGNPVLHS